jgi:transcription elongation factor Elf1
MKNPHIRQTRLCRASDAETRYVCNVLVREVLVDTEKYARSVGLLCPTCGSDQFSHSGEVSDDYSIVTCTGCGRQMTREELVRENSENVDGHLANMAMEITGDLQQEINKSLRDAFKGNRNVKFK